MTRTLLLAFAAIAALVLTAVANAKELTRVTICGKGDRCAVVDDPERLRLVPLGGSTSVPAPPAQPFYWMTLWIEHGWSEPGEPAAAYGLYYVRGENLLAANRVEPGRLVWLPIADPRSAKLMRDAARGIEPHPTPKSWPRELKSTYRVIPDDELADVQVAPTSPPVRRAGGDDGSGTGLAAAIALGLAAAALFLRRLAGHQPRDQLA